MTGVDGGVPCPRCRLAQTPEGEALAALIKQWIDAIPEERRTGADANKKRLGHCDACPHLSGGLCALCGCYVEYRAALAWQRCPDTPARW